MSRPLLQFDQIVKSFFGVPVLHGITFDVPAGQTLGLVGENGAGKSTLMNVLGGVLSADTGSMHMDGAAYVPLSPRDAERVGISFIHQELNLFPSLSIAENLFLTCNPGRWGWIRRSVQHAEAEKLLQRVGLNVAPGMAVDRLSLGERQLVEIAKALNHQSKLVIFDEPTTSLSETETRRLFDLIDSLHRQGIAIIYISHALEDVRRLCDRVVVLRDGRVVGDGPISQFDTHRMVNLMVGREVDQLFPAQNLRTRGEPLFVANGLSQPGVVHEIDLTLHRGEVVGIAGLMGSGRTELARILFGLDEHSEGSISLNGEDITGRTVRERIAKGMAFVTESRRDDGLFLQSSIDENLVAVAAAGYGSSGLGWLNHSRLAQESERISQAVHVKKTVDRRQPVCTLSGGNQQKIVLGKWLLNDPQVLILDDPTRGIDVGAKLEIYAMIGQLASRGSAILVISSELDELIGLCDRILVMSRGEIRDGMNRDEFDRERILHAALHAGLEPSTTHGDSALNGEGVGDLGSSSGGVK